MSDTLTLTIDVQDGNLAPTAQHKAAVKMFLRGRKKPVRMVLSKKTDVRNNEQNRLYWGFYVAPVARFTGHSQEDIHDVFRDLFLPRRFVTLGNIEKEIRKTTTDLSPSEFSEYLLAIEAWTSTELGLMLPDGVVPDVARAG